MAERILMNEFKALSQEKWVHIEVRLVRLLRIRGRDPSG